MHIMFSLRSSPGMNEGICTVTDGVEFPERCPGCQCFDPSLSSSDAPSVCVPE